MATCKTQKHLAPRGADLLGFRQGFKRIFQCLTRSITALRMVRPDSLFGRVPAGLYHGRWKLSELFVQNYLIRKIPKFVDLFFSQFTLSSCTSKPTCVNLRRWPRIRNCLECFYISLDWFLLFLQLFDLITKRKKQEDSACVYYHISVPLGDHGQN